MSEQSNKSSSCPSESTWKTHYEQLVRKAQQPFKSTVTYTYLDHPERLVEPFGLLKALDLDDSFLSDSAKKTLSCIEGVESQLDNELYCKFRWQLMSFVYLQDIFDAPLFNPNPFPNMFRQWYFYYESGYILRELILCGLNNFQISVRVLLRLFMEFNIQQLYIYRAINRDNSYAILEKYFKDRKKPSWNTLLNGCLPKDGFSKPIKKRLHMHMCGLSEKASHAYHPTSSAMRSGCSKPEPVLEGLFFWCTVQFILESVLWAYYVNFPMLFHPKNILRKFGYNSPVGIYIDEMGGHVVKCSLDSDDYTHFTRYTGQNDVVMATNKFYDDRKDLTDEEIAKTWDGPLKGKLTGIVQGYCQTMAGQRGLKELMATSWDDPSCDYADSDIKKYIDMFRYDQWRAIYKHIRS